MSEPPGSSACPWVRSAAGCRGPESGSGCGIGPRPGGAGRPGGSAGLGKASAALPAGLVASTVNLATTDAVGGLGVGRMPCQSTGTCGYAEPCSRHRLLRPGESGGGDSRGGRRPDRRCRRLRCSLSRITVTPRPDRSCVPLTPPRQARPPSGRRSQEPCPPATGGEATPGTVGQISEAAPVRSAAQPGCR